MRENPEYSSFSLITSFSSIYFDVFFKNIPPSQRLDRQNYTQEILLHMLEKRVKLALFIKMICNSKNGYTILMYHTKEYSFHEGIFMAM